MKFIFLIFLSLSFSAHAKIAPLHYNIGEDFTGQFGFLFQGWANWNENKTDNDQDLRLRRAEFHFDGKIANTVTYFLMVDPALIIPPPGISSIDWDFMFQDIGFRYRFSKEFEILLGQFKIPTTSEGLRPSWDLYLPERSLIGRTFGNIREMGLMLAFEKPTVSIFAMASNGKTIAVSKKEQSASFYSRITYLPFENFALAAFLGFDEFNNSEVGGDIHYRWEKFDLKAQYNQGVKIQKDIYGYSFDVYYWINENLAPAARYEVFNQDKKNLPLGYALTLGLDYFLREDNLKFQLVGSSLYNMKATNGSPNYAEGERNFLISFCLQFFFL